MFVSRNNPEKEPKQSDWIGGFKNELSAGDYGVTFLASGLKCYTLVLASGKIHQAFKVYILSIIAFII